RFPQESEVDSKRFVPPVNTVGRIEIVGEEVQRAGKAAWLPVEFSAAGERQEIVRLETLVDISLVIGEPCSEGPLRKPLRPGTVCQGNAHIADAHALDLPASEKSAIIEAKIRRIEGMIPAVARLHEYPLPQARCFEIRQLVPEERKRQAVGKLVAIGKEGKPAGLAGHVAALGTARKNSYRRSPREPPEISPF